MSIATTGTPGVSRFTRDQLLRTARLLSADPELSTTIDLGSTRRTWRRLDATAHLEIWAVGWPPGSGTGWHDHGPSEGVVLPVLGDLVERSWSGRRVHDRRLGAEDGRTFGAHHAHAVVNAGDRPALSLHVYSPALRGGTRFTLAADRLSPLATASAGDRP